MTAHVKKGGKGQEMLLDNSRFSSCEFSDLHQSYLQQKQCSGKTNPAVLNFEACNEIIFHFRKNTKQTNTKLKNKGKK